MDCPICFEYAQKSFESPCGHKMCCSCFDKWKEEQLSKSCCVTCPTCRFVIIETASVKVDIYDPPAGYVEIPEEDEFEFPSIPENVYNRMIELDECDEEEDEDFDGKDDWDYEDMDNYIISETYND